MADDGNNTWLGVCCILIIIIAGIAFITGIFSDNKSIDDSDLPKLNTTNVDSFFYYGEDTPAGKSGYTYAIVVDGKPYYMGDNKAELLAHNGERGMIEVINYDLQKYEGRFTPSQYIVGRSGIHAVYDTTREHDNTMFEFEKMGNYMFSYRDGQEVGLNKNASVVVKLYYLNGTEITEEKK